MCLTMLDFDLNIEEHSEHLYSVKFRVLCTDFMCFVSKVLLVNVSLQVLQF